MPSATPRDAFVPVATAGLTRRQLVARLAAAGFSAAVIDAIASSPHVVFAQEATPVRVHMKGDTVELKAITQDVGEAHEELDAGYAGQELMVAFNPQYLLDGVEVTPGEQVTLETVDALKPALIRSVDTPDFVYLLMPVRVS